MTRRSAIHGGILSRFVVGGSPQYQVTSESATVIPRDRLRFSMDCVVASECLFRLGFSLAFVDEGY